MATYAVGMEKASAIGGRVASRKSSQTEVHFGDALRDLVQAMGDDRFFSPNRNINWMEFVKAELEPRGIKYETLRKAIAGERSPSASLIETVAQVVGVRPEYFIEYRLAEALRQFDPNEVGFETARDNLRKWAEASTKRR